MNTIHFLIKLRETICLPGTFSHPTSYEVIDSSIVISKHCHDIYLAHFVIWKKEFLKSLFYLPIVGEGINRAGEILNFRNRSENLWGP